jgi:hypothetical protein
VSQLAYTRAQERRNTEAADSTNTARSARFVGYNAIRPPPAARGGCEREVGTEREERPDDQQGESREGEAGALYQLGGGGRRE